MSERSTPDGHDAEGNYDWRNDPLENTPIVRGYQPMSETTTPVADEDMFYAGIYWVWATPGLGLRVATPKECAAEIIRLRALITPTPPAQDAPHGAGARRTADGEGETPEGTCGACGAERDDKAWLLWDLKGRRLEMKASAERPCRDPLMRSFDWHAHDRFERMIKMVRKIPIPPAQPSSGALWCRSCGTVFTPPLECDCERMGAPELRDAIPYTDDEPGGAP